MFKWHQVPERRSAEAGEVAGLPGVEATRRRHRSVPGTKVPLRQTGVAVSPSHESVTQVLQSLAGFLVERGSFPC